MNDEIKIGDVVRIRSGGPPMTVVRCLEGQLVSIEWFDGRGERRDGFLDRRALVLNDAIEQEWAAEQLEASVRRLGAESIRTDARLDGVVERLRALEQRAPAAPEAGCSGADLFSIRSRLTANEERFRVLAEERILPLEGGVSSLRTEVDALSLAGESRDSQVDKHQAEIERAHVRLDSLREDQDTLQIWQTDRDKKIAAVAERLERAENIIGLTAGLLIPLVQEIRTRPATDRQTGAMLKDLEQALTAAIAAKDGGSR